MGGSPKLGARVEYESKQRKLASAAQDLLNAPQSPQYLGSLDLNQISPPAKTSTWTDADGTSFTIDEPPPPWEVDPRHGKDTTNARRFLARSPTNVEFRWINPKLLDSQGWRDWQPVMTSDDRFKLKREYETSMSDVTNNIRKGPGGPILAFMPTSWVESRKRMKLQRAQAAKARSADRHDEVANRINRGDFGRYVQVDGTPKYPTNTQLDGRLARQDTE